MVPRGKLSISVAEIFSAIWASIVKADPSIEPNSKYGDAIFCLSARTALDLTLRALNLNAGSEIIVTNINIPDMFAIIEANQLRLVPVAINKHTLGLSAEEIERNITPQTKALLVTHLFGAIINMEEIINVAKNIS